MMRPIIFSGTTEGRQMSERLSAAGIDHIVCVATEYGELVMQRTPHADIRQGRLDAEGMKKLFSAEASSVFDATHPYAAEVSENIREACGSTHKGYVRILRAEPGPEMIEGNRIFADAASCAKALKDTAGNILLTTGSRDIAVYAADPGVRSRLFARIIPSEESIRFCSAADISGRQVIAMQGPFSCEMNKALIMQYGIKLLVTKASGTEGGFQEKISAARECGIPVFIIGKPVEEQGMTASEALEVFFEIKPVTQVDLIGTGPGRESLMTEEAREAVRKADVIFGAERMIASYPGREAYPYYLARDMIPVLEERRPERIAVLFSGDTGFCSGAAKTGPELAAWFEESGSAYVIRQHPGISSFAYLAAVTGEPYTNAGLCSMHGRTGDEKNEKEVIRAIREHGRTYLLLSGEEDVKRLGSLLTENGLGECMVVLGYKLAGPEERIELLRPEECQYVSEKGLYTALILNEDPAEPAEPAVKEEPAAEDMPAAEDAPAAEEIQAAEADEVPGERFLMPVIADDEFMRAKVPMTKENIRHLSIIKLGLKEGSVLYDIGSGTGTIACEAAMQSAGLKVYAIEMRKAACDLIEKNADKFGLANIEVVNGRAPEAFGGLEAPTHAFIGGSSGELKDILDVLAEAPYGVRVVINAVSLETMAEIKNIPADYGVTDLSIEQISVNRSRELGNYHLMTAENPVLIAAFTLGGKE